MITATAATLDLIGGARYTTHWRLLIEDADGAMRDYSDQEGIDWRKSADWGKTVDQPIADGTVEVFMEADGISLAPLIGGSPLNRNAGGGYAKAIDMGRKLQIWTQDTEVGVSPVEADWVLVHDAIIQKVGKGRGVLRLFTLDRASLLNRIIRHDFTYGTEAGTPVADVMQALIDDTLGAGVFTLQLDGDPQYAIREAGPFTGSSVWDALEKLSAEFAGYVEYRDALTLVTPDRSTPTAASAVATIGPDQYKTIPRLDTDLADIRNDIDVTFRNSDTGAIETVNAVDAASKVDYDEQYMGITLGEDSAVDTTAEAQDMADRIVSDIGVPRYNQQVVNFYWYPVELGDHITWEANGRDYDSDQHWAVTGYRHHLSRDKRETTFDVRGKASAGFKRWTRKGDKEAGPDPDLTLSVTPLTKTETSHTLRIARDTASIAEVWRYSRTVAQDAVVPDIETVQAEDEPQILTIPAAGHVDDTITVPDPDTVTYVWYVPYTADLEAGVVAGPVEVDPLDPEYPEVDLDDAEDATSGTQWVKVVERGLSVSAVQFQTMVGNHPATAFGAPTRSEGATSKVKGGTLGPGEYEHDVALATDRFSWITGKITLETGEVQVLGPFGFDRNKQPDFLAVRVSGTNVEVSADSDTASIELERIDGGGTWVKHRDGRAHTFDVATADDSGNAGITGNAVWVMRITAYSDPKADVSGSSLMTTQDVTVESGSGGTAPFWADTDAFAPVEGSADATISLLADANGAVTTDYEVKVLERYNEGAGWTTFFDVTGNLSPVPSSPPTTKTDYTRTTRHSRVSGSLTGDEALVKYEWRCEIREVATGNVEDSSTVAASWYTDSAVPV